jgi:uncharacterized protein YceH (UPF0502 family)
MARGLGVPSQSAALLTMLTLRGPQTSAELRLHTERLHRFVDISSVEGFLEELTEKTPTRVVKLPKAPGEREARWAHLLCGEPIVPAYSAQSSAGSAPDAASQDEIRALQEEQRRLRAEISSLKTLVLRMAAELGIEPNDTPSEDVDQA